MKLKILYFLMGMAVCAIDQSHAASFAITNATTNASQQTLGANETGFISNGSAVIRSATSETIVFSGNNAALTNLGTVRNSDTTGGNTRAIRSANVNLTGLYVSNGPLGLIQGGNDDGIQIRGASSTFTLHNSGLFYGGATGGQAVDLDNITAGNSLIVNYAGGVLYATAADALRPGANNILTNHGSIFSDGGDAYDAQAQINSSIYNYGIITGSERGLKLNSGYIENSGTLHGSGVLLNDGRGIRFDTVNAAYTGRVNNLSTGVITGSQHGVESKTSFFLTNAAGGLIVGLNGSGVNVDSNAVYNANGTVVNYGTILGQTNAAGGDGDGVDIDGHATVYNYGIIRATGSTGGASNNSEGVASGGGYIYNTNGALISGFSRGIFNDDSNDGPAPFASVIENYGTIVGSNDFAIGLVGTQNDFITNGTGGLIQGNAAASVTTIQMNGGNDTLVNSGTILGHASGTAIHMGTGNDLVVLKNGSAITGTLDGGGGTDTLRFDPGTGNTLTVANTLTNFTALHADSGTTVFDGSYRAASTTVATNATLRGGGTLADVTLNSGGSLAGTLTVSNISGAGAVNPGNSPGILTASSVDPSGGLDFNFEFTGFNPYFLNASASTNDLLRITGATPFSSSMTSANLVSVYLNVASVSDGDVFSGGFFTDTAGDFLPAMQNASYVYYIQDVLGSYTYNSVNYSLLNFSLYTVGLSTSAQTADFGAGNVNGQIAQFTVSAVPEPSTYLMLLLGGGLVFFLARRKMRRAA
ncbi:MAG: PEP-CTERM sorting domain-containing protein [Verrucomicrobiae bacterium]|nr:PEP-CTERM sorting domain-containing protein [Verrucomicrobiae bacterium]